MKLHELKAKHKFNQNTFYKWMRDSNLIKKTELGYIVGDDALAGMQTLVTPMLNKETGELRDSCQVTIDDEQADLLVELYLNSGLPKLYSPAKSDADNNFAQEELEELRDRIAILENQVNILTIQLKQLMK